MSEENTLFLPHEIIFLILNETDEKSMCNCRLVCYQ